MTDFTPFPFDLEPADQRAVQLGLITLKTDLTIETELRHFIGVSTVRGKQPNIMHSRIISDDQVTTSNLDAMQDQFAASLDMFPPDHAFDVIGYGCTSASLVIGEAKVQSLITAHRAVTHVTTPLTGARRAMRALGAQRIGYLAPYISEISARMCAFLADDGFDIVAAGTFGEGRDSVVGQIDGASIMQAVCGLAAQPTTPLDAIFVSCTALKCAPVIDAAERQLGVPIVTSNAALSWDMARLAGLTVPPAGKGRLFQQN
ncbi:MAG: Asp/Glu racemase [Candidatus Puniceispirillum sp.]